MAERVPGVPDESERRALEGIFRLPLPTPYPVGAVNVYVLTGERPTLVDVGPRTKAAEETLLRGLTDIGLSLRDIEHVVITHTHVDHHGLLERVKTLHPGVRVSAHAAAWPGFGRDVEDRLEFYDRLFTRSGLPSDVRPSLVAGMKQLIALEPRVGVDEWLHDGDVFPAGDGTWRVVHTPGHASDLISLYREATGTLMTSDHLLPAVSSNAIVEPPPPGAKRRSKSLIQYMDALRKVALLPVTLALPGHGPPFVDVADLVNERLAMHEARLRDVEARLPGGGHRPTVTPGRDGVTVYELATDMFTPRDLDTLTLALSEVQGHLDVLVARERAVEDEQDGVVVYRSVG